MTGPEQGREPPVGDSTHPLRIVDVERTSSVAAIVTVVDAVTGKYAGRAYLDKAGDMHPDTFARLLLDLSRTCEGGTDGR